MRSHRVRWQIALALAVTGVMVTVAITGVAFLAPSSTHGGVAQPRVSSVTTPFASTPAVYYTGVVNGTIVLDNNSYIRGNYQGNLAIDPDAAVYDPSNGNVYVADENSNNLTELNTSRDLAVANFPTGTYDYASSDPAAIALDTNNGDLYIANSGDNTVLVWNPVTQSNVTLIPVAATPDAIAYDPVGGDVFVAAGSANTVQVIAPATNSVVGQLAVGNDPDGIAVDSANGRVFVANSGSSNISVLNNAGTTLLQTFNLTTTFNQPAAVCYAPFDQDMFVADGASGNVTVLNASTDTYDANISVEPFTDLPALDACTFDPTTSTVYVTDADNELVAPIDAKTQAVGTFIAVGSTPMSIVYDAGTNDVYVPAGGSVNVTIIDAATNLATGTILLTTMPWDVTFDATNSKVWATSVIDVPLPPPLFGINADSNTVTPAVPGAYSAINVLYDPTNGYVYATGSQFGVSPPPALGVYSGSTGAYVTDDGGLTPYALGFDSANGELYAGGITTGGEVLVGYNISNDQNFSTPLTSNPEAIAYDPGNGDLYVSCGGTGYTSEIFVVGAANGTIVSTIATGTPTDGITYDPASHYMYVTDLFNGTAVVNTETNTIINNISIEPGEAPVTSTSTTLRTATSMSPIWSTTMWPSSTGPATPY